MLPSLMMMSCRESCTTHCHCNNSRVEINVDYIQYVFHPFFGLTISKIGTPTVSPQIRPAKKFCAFAEIREISKCLRGLRGRGQDASRWVQRSTRELSAAEQPCAQKKQEAQTLCIFPIFTAYHRRSVALLLGSPVRHEPAARWLLQSRCVLQGTSSLMQACFSATLSFCMHVCRCCAGSKTSLRVLDPH